MRAGIYDKTYVALDTLLYGGVSYTMHKITDTQYFQNVYASDILGYFVSDGIFYLVRPKIIDYFSTDNKKLVAWFSTKFLITTAGLFLIDLIMGGRHKLVGTAVNNALVTGIQGAIYAGKVVGGTLGEAIDALK